MRFRSPINIIILRTISCSWTLFLAIGMLDIRTFAENNVNQIEELHSVMQNSSKNETIENTSKLTIPVTEKQSRMLHKLEYYSIKKENPHPIFNNSDLQNRSIESKVLPLRSSEKTNISKKPTQRISGWLFNGKSPVHEKREAYDETRKSSASENHQYDAQAYKEYYQQQNQQEQSKSEYTDSYNTIPSNPYIDEYRDYGNNNIAEEQDMQTWKNSYYPEESYSSYGCPCYKQANNRQTNGNCDTPGASFLQTLGTLGANLWQLIQIMATSSVPFIIPILALKLILVPLKILKFLHLIKFFFKLFIVLPFIIRVFYPAITNGLGLQNFFYSKPSHPDHHYDHFGSREETNATENWNSDLEEYVQRYSNISGGTLLRACPSKAACELGSFLSTTNTKFPEKLSKYLLKKTEVAEEAEKTSEKDASLESEKESAIRAFTIALGRKWSIEQCAVYTCSLSL